LLNCSFSYCSFTSIELHASSMCLSRCFIIFFFFFFNATAPTEIYTLSLHDALPISAPTSCLCLWFRRCRTRSTFWGRIGSRMPRSEEHTSELQSRGHLVCRLLLEKKKPIRDEMTRHAATTPD